MVLFLFGRAPLGRALRPPRRQGGLQAFLGWYCRGAINGASTIPTKKRLFTSIPHANSTKRSPKVFLRYNYYGSLYFFKLNINIFFTFIALN